MDKFFEKDYKYFKEWLDMSSELLKLEKHVENTKNYFTSEISLHLQILQKENYIDKDLLLTENFKNLCKYS